RFLEHALLLAAHGCEHRAEAVELGVHDRALELAGARAAGREIHDVTVLASPVEAAAVDGAAPAVVDILVVGDERAAFAAREVLEVVEAERADIADGAVLATVVPAADALAGIFDHEELALAGDLHDRVHVAGQAEDVDGDHGAGVLADGVVQGGRIHRR